MSSTFMKTGISFFADAFEILENKSFRHILCLKSTISFPSEIQNGINLSQPFYVKPDVDTKKPWYCKRLTINPAVKLQTRI